MEASSKVVIEKIGDLRTWLKANHNKSESIWLVKWKKGSGKPYIDYDSIVDELICFGWVDSLPRNLDKQKTMLRISPRNPKSNWSKLNKERVARLDKLSKMEPSGWAMVEVAKANGAWSFLDDVEQLIEPLDLKKALDNKRQARFFFDRFPPSSKRGILEWIKNAKQTSTREQRITETVEKAAINIKANHPKGRDAGPKFNG